MTINLFQIDKSGGNPFEKDYSIALVLDKKWVYGVNIPKDIKDRLIYLFRIGELNIDNGSKKQKKNRFGLRFHTSVIIKLVEQATNDLGILNNVNFQICNDFDGHFHEIKDMVFKNIRNLIPNLQLEDIIETKFPKLSLINTAAKAFRNKDTSGLKNCHHINLDINELIKIIKK